MAWAEGASTGRRLFKLRVPRNTQKIGTETERLLKKKKKGEVIKSKWEEAKGLCSAMFRNLRRYREKVDWSASEAADTLFPVFRTVFPTQLGNSSHNCAEISRFGLGGVMFLL